jgi:ribosome-associated heat shock protein Hsp15
MYRRNNDTARVVPTSGVIELSKQHYRKNGTGRPTKDRRDIDEFEMK